jgi:chromate transporter
MMRGVNATVVGLLGAALYNPVWANSIKAPGISASRSSASSFSSRGALPLIVVVVSALGGIAVTYAT